MEAILVMNETILLWRSSLGTPRFHPHSRSLIIAIVPTHDPPPPSGAPPRIKHDTSLIPHGMKRTEAQ